MITSRAGALRVRPRVLLGGTALIAALLLAIVVIPQTLSRHARLEVVRSHVGEVARMAASAVDGELHRQLLDGETDEQTRARAREPLLRLHRAWPEARYVYTMFSRDGEVFFVLDTAQDAPFAAERDLRASEYLEPFHLRAEYESDWLEVIAAGGTFVNPQYQHDDYGYFLTGHAPIHDATGNIAGFVGVDFDLDYFLAEERRFRNIEFASICAALLLSLLLGYVYARYDFNNQAELRHHRETSLNDSLTGLLNRRGADAAIRRATEGGPGDHCHAALLVDIDHFKSINDGFGHAEGDAVISRVAQALRGCPRAGAVPARLGGDEFLVFVPDCDRESAERVAAELLEAVRDEAAGQHVPYAVSIGVGVARAEEGGFDLLYRRADAALYQAKSAGKNRYAMYGSTPGQ